jgi:hypothetical protein
VLAAQPPTACLSVRGIARHYRAKPPWLPPDGRSAQRTTLAEVEGRSKQRAPLAEVGIQHLDFVATARALADLCKQGKAQADADALPLLARAGELLDPGARV